MNSACSRSTVAAGVTYRHSGWWKLLIWTYLRDHATTSISSGEQGWVGITLCNCGKMVSSWSGYNAFYWTWISWVQDPQTLRNHMALVEAWIKWFRRTPSSHLCFIHRARVILSDDPIGGATRVTTKTALWGCMRGEPTTWCVGLNRVRQRSEQLRVVVDHVAELPIDLRREDRDRPSQGKGGSTMRLYLLSSSLQPKSSEGPYVPQT